MIAASTAALAYYEAFGGRREVEFGVAELARAGAPAAAAPWHISPAVSVGSRRLWAGSLDAARETLLREYDQLVRRAAC